MKKVIAVLIALVMILGLVGCSGNGGKSYESAISGIELLAVEAGVAYYNVRLSAGADWNESTSNHEEIADDAVQQCVPLAKKENAHRMWVTGYTSSGELAFSWDGGSAIKYYRSDKFEYEIYLSSQQEDDYKIK